MTPDLNSQNKLFTDYNNPNLVPQSSQHLAEYRAQPEFGQHISQQNFHTPTKNLKPTLQDSFGQARKAEQTTLLTTNITNNRKLQPPQKLSVAQYAAQKIPQSA
jgi:hypothetical protein